MRGPSAGPSIGPHTKTVLRWLASLGFEPGSSAWVEFLSPRLSRLTPPDAMFDRRLAATRLAEAIRKGEPLVVFGDYDCDGMTSTAILTEGLRSLGAASVKPFVASRFAGGYGLSAEAVERVLEGGPRLVVTCDCGSSDHESLRVLRERGVDAIVIDHHLVPDEPLPALAFLNPHRPECEFPFKGLASCGLALSMVAAVRTELGKELDVRQWLDLVAIGTIADVAPLNGDNRALTRAGLEQLALRKRPGLSALLELIGFETSHRFTASDIAFRVAPRLNAPGRIGSPEIAVELLLERDPMRARELALRVEELCQKRRTDQEVILREALEDAEAQVGRETALVLGREGWNHGIVGIVAGRIADTCGVPTIVIGFSEGWGHGSVRGPAGFRLFDAVSECSEHLVRFGGHQAAAGLEVRLERLGLLRASFLQACRRQVDFERPRPRTPLVVDPSDDLGQLLDDLYLLEPCGEGNPRPELVLDVVVERCRQVRGGHLKLDLSFGSQQLSGFGPELGARGEGLSGLVRIEGELRPDRYRGGNAVEILVRGFERLSASASREL